MIKNTTQGFLNKDFVYFNENIVKKYNLRTNYASIKPILEIFNAQSNDLLRMTPRSGEHNLDPDHFLKMRVATSTFLLRVDVATTQQRDNIFIKQAVVMNLSKPPPALCIYYENGSKLCRLGTVTYQ